jgi:hypothetical protein
MPHSRRDRDRRPGRRAPFREPKPVILIVCEGTRTEPEYLFGFARACRNPRVRIEIAPEHGVPKTLVETAKRRKRQSKASAKREKDENLAFDSVWCVFDIDDHPHVPDAIQMARDNGIQLAVSNPAFELWLLLHFRENPGMQTRDSLRQMLKGFVPGYDKQVDYSIYSDGYADAAARAKQMDELAESADEARRNPSTGVYKLTRCIQQE